MTRWAVRWLSTVVEGEAVVRAEFVALSLALVAEWEEDEGVAWRRGAVMRVRPGGAEGIEEDVLTGARGGRGGRLAGSDVGPPACCGGARPGGGYKAYGC